LRGAAFAYACRPRVYSPTLAARTVQFHPELLNFMAKNSTFDITSTLDLQEVDNAVNQADKEISQRYDFKGSTAEIEFSKADSTLTLLADDEYKLKAVVDVLQSKLIRRGVPIRNLDYGEVDSASGGMARQVITLQQGISTEKGKEIVKEIKAGGFKKVQAQIQDDQVRVQSASIDELQQVIAMLKQKDFGLELQFGNFRS
jgi:uncharacterized protein YajQ (UPF0234 family)